MGFGHILGLQIVGPCCGALIDMLYEEFGMRFFEAYLEDFRNDPLSRDNKFARHLLIEAVGQWRASAMEQAAASAAASQRTHEAEAATG